MQTTTPKNLQSDLLVVYLVAKTKENTLKEYHFSYQNHTTQFVYDFIKGEVDEGTFDDGFTSYSLQEADAVLFEYENQYNWDEAIQDYDISYIHVGKHKFEKEHGPYFVFAQMKPSDSEEFEKFE